MLVLTLLLLEYGFGVRSTKQIRLLRVLTLLLLEYGFGELLMNWGYTT